MAPLRALAAALLLCSCDSLKPYESTADDAAKQARKLEEMIHGSRVTCEPIMWSSSVKCLVSVPFVKPSFLVCNVSRHDCWEEQ